MTDLYLKAPTEADMNAALIAAGLAYEQTITVQVDEETTEEQTVLLAAPGVSLDVIGQISRITGYDEADEPIIATVDGWHVNVRCYGLTEEQEAEIEAIKIVPPETPYRVWA